MYLKLYFCTPFSEYSTDNKWNWAMSNSKVRLKKKKALVYSLNDSFDDDMAINDSIPLMSHQEYSNFDQDDYLSEGGRKQGYGMYSNNHGDRRAESFCNRCCWCMNKACSNVFSL